MTLDPVTLMDDKAVGIDCDSMRLGVGNMGTCPSKLEKCNTDMAETLEQLD